jgi:hypothetical protein
MTGMLPVSLAETNGLCGWILDDPALASLSQQLEQIGGRVLMHPRVQTAHAIQSSMMVGDTVPVSGAAVGVGLALDLMPLIQTDGMDLMSVFTITESITNRASGTSANQATPDLPGAEDISVATNLVTVARWKLPAGSGFFLLGPMTSNDSRRVGVILTATVQRPKR